MSSSFLQAKIKRELPPVVVHGLVASSPSQMIRATEFRCVENKQVALTTPKAQSPTAGSVSNLGTSETAIVLIKFNPNFSLYAIRSLRHSERKTTFPKFPPSAYPFSKRHTSRHLPSRTFRRQLELVHPPSTHKPFSPNHPYRPVSGEISFSSTPHTICPQGKGKQKEVQIVFRSQTRILLDPPPDCLFHPLC